jgi:lysyl-tRNA synthetase class 1
MPARAQELSATQRAFLQTLAKLLADTPWEGDRLQVCIFNATRLTPIDQPSAFKAIYRVLLDRENGPKAGNFLSFLDRDFVIKRFAELPVDQLAFWTESSVDLETVAQWLRKEKANVALATVTLNSHESAPYAIGVEFLVTMADQKKHLRRVLQKSSVETVLDRNQVKESIRSSLADLETQSGLKVVID